MQFIDGQTLAALIQELRHPPQAPQPPDAPAPGTTPATLPNGTLSTERTARAPVLFHTVARLGIQAAEALEHQRTAMGIVHRDVKPANLLLDTRWQFVGDRFSVC